MQTSIVRVMRSVVVGQMLRPLDAFPQGMDGGPLEEPATRKTRSFGPAQRFPTSLRNALCWVCQGKRRPPGLAGQWFARFSRHSFPVPLAGVRWFRHPWSNLLRRVLEVELAVFELVGQRGSGSGAELGGGLGLEGASRTGLGLSLIHI